MQEEIFRKLAAIMFTDIFGFTSLMEKDEADAMKKKRSYKEILHQFHNQYNGKIIKDMGDGSLSVFTNSVDADSVIFEFRNHSAASTKFLFTLAFIPGMCFSSRVM